jgi:hypothetical protein
MSAATAAFLGSGRRVRAAVVPLLLAIRGTRWRVDKCRGANISCRATEKLYLLAIKDEAPMRLPLHLLIVMLAILLGAVETGSAANSKQRTAHRAATAQGNWCLYYRAGGANCQFGDFQSCEGAAGGRCQLSPSWRARYGDQLPPLERWQYGGIPDRCVNAFDARCY